jgi:hypothetical protein
MELSEYSPIIIWVTKSRSMRWVGHMREKTGVYRVFVGKDVGKRPLGKPWHRWDEILKWISGKRMRLRLD